MKFGRGISLGIIWCACAMLASCSTTPPEPGKPLQIIAIDVEGGAATLYITPEGKSLLVDTGWPTGRGGRRPPAGAPASTDPSSADKIIAAARRAGLSKLDIVLITHYHVDHVGGLGELMSKFQVGELLDHGPNRETPSVNDNPANDPMKLYAEYERLIAGYPRRSLKPGDTVKIGSVVLTIMTSDGAVIGTPLPDGGQSTPLCAAMTDKLENGGEENARSVGFLLNYGSARVVSLGDLTWNVEKDLVCPVNKAGRTDLLFVSNHGSNLNNSPALLHALTPRVAIMNNGARKGGDTETFDTLSAAPGLQRLWQLHFSTKGGMARNPAEAYIANLTDEPDQYAALYVSVFADGRMTVLNGRSGFSESYAPTLTQHAGK